MNKQYHLTPDQVPGFLKGTYSGKKFRVEIRDSITLMDTYWHGGTKSTYKAVDLSTHSIVDDIAADSNAPGFGHCRDGEEIPLQPNIAVIKHSVFCGKDMGLVFYIHPNNKAQLITEQSSELTRNQEIVLIATRSLKSSYGGVKNFRFVEANNNTGITLDDWNKAKQSLIDAKLLDKRGAITVSGRNACPNKQIHQLRS